MRPRTRRMLTPLVAGALLAANVALGAASASAASATPSPEPSAAASPAAPATGSAGTYASLTSALMAMNAAKSGTTLDAYLSANQLMVQAAGNGGSSGVLGSGGKLTASMGATALTGTDVAGLDSQLSAAGLTLDLRNYTNLQDMAADVVAKANTSDGAVTLAGAQWVAELGALRAPALQSATAGTPNAPAVPAEALAFGLLLDKSLAATVLNSPDLFAQAAASGVGSAALSKVFSTQMLGAWQDSNKSLTSALPNPCTGGMLAVMATGDTGSLTDYPSCAPACATGGLYLNGQVSKLFSGSSNETWGDTGKDLWNMGTLYSLYPWQQTQMLEQNPNLVQGLLSDNTTSGAALGCSAASTSATAALGATLPGVFANLRSPK